MIDSILQELLATDDPAKKAAIVAEAVFKRLLEETAEMARRCVLFHWFDQPIIEALVQGHPATQTRSTEIYEQLLSLPFIASLPWGAAFHTLTREGLLKHYSVSQPGLFIDAAKQAAPAYSTRESYGMAAAEAFFCYVVAGKPQVATQLLDTLFEEALHCEEWSYISALIQLQREAEELPFVQPLPLTEMQWIVRGLAHQAQGKRESAAADYSHAIGINPQNPSAYLARGTIYAEQQDYDKALADYSQALYKQFHKEHSPGLEAKIGAFEKQSLAGITNFSRVSRYRRSRASEVRYLERPFSSNLPVLSHF